MVHYNVEEDTCKKIFEDEFLRLASKRNETALLRSNYLCMAADIDIGESDGPKGVQPMLLTYKRGK